MNKKWEYRQIDEKKVEEISEKFHISELVSSILVNRGIIEDEEIRVFLNPTRDDFYDPFLLPDIEIAVQRIIKAIQNQDNVIIYGDYDVDGITSTTVLKKFLEERNMKVDFYIPNRLKEGYGLNKEAIKQIAEKGYQLIITVDCGISGIEEVEYANSLGIETIITDHHEPLENLPNAIAVVDPKRKDSRYPFHQLAGVGVVFKVIQAVSKRLRLEDKDYLKYLDLVCVGTISDIVPLVDENRVIAKLGLKLVAMTKNLGLRELIQSSGYRDIDSNTISFGIAPRVNACGRMGYEEEALNLFLSQDQETVTLLTQKLNQYNKDRQETEKRIFEQALEMIEKDKEYENSAIILGNDQWHHGVIGIVSSKITDMYFKPSILICFEGEEGKGSGRSIPGFDLHNALCSCSNHLEKYGGHEMAVGLSLKKEEFERFKKEFETYAQKEKVKEIVPVIYIDHQITEQEMTFDTIEQLKLLEPFGEGNKKPLFTYKGLKIDSIRALSEGRHLKLTLKDENNTIHAIGFNMGHLTSEYLIGDKIDIVGYLELNHFNGVDTIQMNLKDVMRSI